MSNTTFDLKARSRDDAAPVTLYHFRGSEQAEVMLEHLIQSMTIIPGTTEFGYGTTAVKKGHLQNENTRAGGSLTDFRRAIDQLIDRAPNLKHVSLVVAWHGNDLRIGECTIKPRVEIAAKATTPYLWQVGPTVRNTADIVTYINGNPAAGGAPADRSVYEAIVYLRAKGLKVTVYPFILMDIPSNNGLPDPYGSAQQPAYPWRGRITTFPAPGQAGSPDGTAAAATQVANFFGTVSAGNFSWNAGSQIVNYSGPANEWSFRRHILHIATIAKAAGATDFLIGTEMVGMTTIRSGPTTFPAVDQLVSLLAQVRAVVGAGMKLSYAADWTEYNNYQAQDGTGDLLFHLDPLWANADIDYVGIDNYLPSADWRVGDDHLDKLAGYQTIYDLNYLRSQVQGGEDYDFFYASQSDRDNQIRTPITDGNGKPWVYRKKDIPNWWGNQHFNRVGGGIESSTPTAWVPESKPIVFTEIGCSATNRGANQPNVFVDPKSSESFLPRYSLGVRDDLMQRSYLEAQLTFWDNNNPVSSQYSGSMLDMSRLSIWTWDARPFPDFPNADDFWGDAPNWEVGHWLNGRIEKPPALTGASGEFRYTDAERVVEYGGFEYIPLPIKPGKMKTEGNLPRNAITFSLPRNSPLAEVFKSFRPAYPLTLTIYQGHLSDEEAFFLPRWSGRITSSKRRGEEVQLSGIPHTVALARAGLKRNYQIGCPHALYGPMCKADLARATTAGNVSSVNGAKITLGVGWNGAFDPSKFVTGFAEWITDAGEKERRRILAVNGSLITLSGPATNLDAGDGVSMILGCNHTVQECRDLHNNLENCGACPTIPLKNPYGSDSNNFY